MLNLFLNLLTEESKTMKRHLIILFSFFIITTINVAHAKSPCQVEPCPGGPVITIPKQKGTLHNQTGNPAHPSLASKRPHPKWKKFWADFREGFGEGFGPIHNGNSQGGTGIKGLDRSIQQYIKQNRLGLKDIERMIATSKNIIKNHPGNITREDLVKVFHDKHFVKYISHYQTKRGPRWGRILGRIIGRIAWILLDNALNP